MHTEDFLTRTHSDRDHEDARIGKERWMVQGLPNGITPAFIVRVQRHLPNRQFSGYDIVDAIYGSIGRSQRTSVSNQNLSGNCRKIFVYVPCRSIVTVHSGWRNQDQRLPWTCYGSPLVSTPEEME